MPETVLIEKLVYGGDGLSRLDGQVVLTPFVLPGEQVNIEISGKSKSVLRGVPISVVSESEQRVMPLCPYFGKCGGCQYQHATPPYQVQQKVEILRESLARLGGFEYAGEIHAIAGEPWGYRNRVQLHFAHGRVGFRRAGSHQLEPIDHCPISAPILSEAIHNISEAVRQPQWPAFLQSLELFTNGSELQLNVLQSTRPVASRFFTWCKTFLPQLAPGAIDYEAAGSRYRVSGGSFFQVNRFLVDALVQEVLHEVTKAGHAVDLFAGVGLFSVALSKKFDHVEAVERGLSAGRDLEYNIAASNVHVEPVRADAEQFMSEMKERPDWLIADPPRAGLGSTLVSQILRIQPEALAIVSCDPATLARDCRALLDAYSLQRLTLVDLFPQTYHFETVMHLQCK